MHRFLGWNISNGTLQTNWKPETQVLQAKEETREESLNTRQFQILLQVTNLLLSINSPFVHPVQSTH